MDKKQLRSFCSTFYCLRSTLSAAKPQCVGQELNLQCPWGRVGYSHLGTPMPSRRVVSFFICPRRDSNPQTLVFKTSCSSVGIPGHARFLCSADRSGLIGTCTRILGVQDRDLPIGP